MNIDSGEAIGRMVRDMRRNQVESTSLAEVIRNIYPSDKVSVVDVTAIYDGWIGEDSAWRIYEDSVLRPPLLDALYCWINVYGNTCVAATASWNRADDPDGFAKIQWQPIDQEHTIDWDDVEWVTLVQMWFGGRAGDGRPMRTTGPLGVVKLAINADGQMLDSSWILPYEYPHMTDDVLQFELCVITKAITFLNCRNVEVREPARGRAEQKRVARTGVTVNEIHVKPVGSYSRGKPRLDFVRLSASGPLSMVRGHVAHYGCHGREGLLFGKISGEFWIPQHHRGSIEQGETTHNYDVEAVTT